MDVKRVVEALKDRGDELFLLGSSGRSYTYNEATCRALALAAVLRTQLSLGPGDRVIVRLPKSIDVPVVYLACLLAGLVVVPTRNTSDPDHEFIRSDADAALVITPQFLEKWREIQDQQWSEFTDLSVPWLITYTSGTTGTPKGIVHSAETLFQDALAFNTAMGIGSGHRFYHTFTMHYLGGILNSLLCPMLAGGSVVIQEDLNILDYWSDVARTRANVLWLTPSIMAALLRTDRGTLGEQLCRSQVHKAFVGTAPLRDQTLFDFERRYGITPLESYGLSETLILTACRTAGYPAGTVGFPLKGVSVRVRGDGEVECRTPHLMLRYVNSAPANREAWFPTGDTGFLVDNLLVITGRKKNLIIRGGVNISPARIEATLLGHTGIQDACVVGIPHDIYGEEIVAAIEVLDMPEGLHSELEAMCRNELPAEAMPESFLWLRQLPRNENGKIDREEIRALARKAQEEGRLA